MQTNNLLIDAFERIKEVVHSSVKGLNQKQLLFRPTKDANSIAWLIWHLTRTQDDHMADAMGTKQIWQDGWSDKFNLPFAVSSTGYGHTSDEVAAVKVETKLLLGYYDAVHKNTIKYLKTLKDEDYNKVVDKRWNPPVTLSVRIVSVLSDDFQHAGQAAYIKGLLK